MDETVADVVGTLLKAAHWTATRSSGPGGQHRDKASTRAELTLTSAAVLGLDAATAERVRDALGLDARPLRIVAQDERSLSRNQQLAIERLTELVADALVPPPPTRRATRPSRARRRARVDDKTRRGSIKRLRQPPPADA
jgi:ribosome-associated protein